MYVLFENDSHYTRIIFNKTIRYKVTFYAPPNQQKPLLRFQTKNVSKVS